MAGVAAFFAFRVAADLTLFAFAADPIFLSPSAAPPSDGDAATYSALTYWGALLVAAVVAGTIPVVRWSQTRDADIASAPTVEQRAAAMAAMAEPFAPAAKPVRLVAAAAKASEPAQPAPGPAWRPGLNAYAEKLRQRYGAARMRRARKLGDKRQGQADRSKTKPYRSTKMATEKVWQAYS